MPNKNPLLLIGGIFSLLAGLLHIAIIIGGSEWYRFFGAGEQMAQMAESGSWTPALITLPVMLVLFVWAAYAFSGAGMMKKLPLLKTGLITITVIYALRTLLLPYALLLAREHFDGLVLWSSLYCLAAALCYGIGIRQGWKDFAR